MAGEKFLKHDAAGGFTETVAPQVGGAGQENLIPALDATGKLDTTMMPTGIGADTASILCNGALAAGDFVNIYDNAAVVTCRLADASALGTRAHGFVMATHLDATMATVYFEGTNDGAGVTGMVGGDVFLAETAGDATTTAPTTTGSIVQKLGVAISGTSINVEIGNPILLA
jgi:hypothetical protein